MNVVAFARLLHRKINAAHKKANNPFVDANFINPFDRPMYRTFVWVEADDDYPKSFDNRKG